VLVKLAGHPLMVCTGSVQGAVAAAVAVAPVSTSTHRSAPVALKPVHLPLMSSSSCLLTPAMTRLDTVLVCCLRVSQGPVSGSHNRMSPL
jgi:hypothetical protein